MKLVCQKKGRYLNPDIYTRMAAIEDEHWWFRGRRAIVASMIQGLGLPSGASVLDAGSGTGGNLSMLLGFGDVVGMELDEVARRLASKKAGVTVVAGRLPDRVPFCEESFDLVTLLDVLEHVEDDQGTLEKLGNLLKPDGVLVLTVPAFPFLWSGHDVVHQHYRRYHLQSLVDRVEAAGLKITYASYYNTLLFPLIALIRLMEKVFGTKGGHDLAVPSPWLNRLLYRIFASERHWLGKGVFPFGVSIVLLARRPA